MLLAGLNIKRNSIPNKRMFLSSLVQFLHKLKGVEDYKLGWRGVSVAKQGKEQLMKIVFQGIQHADIPQLPSAYLSDMD